MMSNQNLDKDKILPNILIKTANMSSVSPKHKNINSKTPGGRNKLLNGRYFNGSINVT